MTSCPSHATPRHATPRGEEKRTPRATNQPSLQGGQPVRHASCLTGGQRGVTDISIAPRRAPPWPSSPFGRVRICADKKGPSVSLLAGLSLPLAVTRAGPGRAHPRHTVYLLFSALLCSLAASPSIPPWIPCWALLLCLRRIRS